MNPTDMLVRFKADTRPWLEAQVAAFEAMRDAYDEAAARLRAELEDMTIEETP